MWAGKMANKGTFQEIMRRLKRAAEKDERALPEAEHGQAIAASPLWLELSRMAQEEIAANREAQSPIAADSAVDADSRRQQQLDGASDLSNECMHQAAAYSRRERTEPRRQHRTRYRGKP